MINPVSVSPSAFDQGAVRLNSDSLATYIANTQARNRAREDAFNKSLADQSNAINESGVRSQDLPAIIDAKNQWQQHTIANRHPIQTMNDHGVAYGQNQKLYGNIKNLIAQSKAAALNNKESEDIIKDPKKAALLTDGSMPAYHKSILSINDPNYQAWDHSDIYNPKPFNNSRLATDINKIKATYTPGQPVPAEGGMQTITSTKSFSPSDLQAVQIRADHEYNADPSFKNYIDGAVANHDTPLYHTLNDIYKQHYGKDIEHPEEASAAYMISLHGEPGAKTVTVKAPIHHNSEAERLDYLDKSLGIRDKHKTAKGAGKQPDTSTPIEDDWNKAIAMADKAPKERIITRADGTVEHWDVLPLTPKQKASFNQRGSDNKVHQATDVLISKDRKTSLPLYENSAKSITGNASVSDISKPISAEDAKYTIGKTNYGAKQVLKEKKIQTEAPPHGQTVKQNGVTYTWNPKTKTYE